MYNFGILPCVQSNFCSLKQENKKSSTKLLPPVCVKKPSTGWSIPGWFQSQSHILYDHLKNSPIKVSTPSGSFSMLWHKPFRLGQVKAKFWNFGQFSWLNFRHPLNQSSYIGPSPCVCFLCQGRDTETMQLRGFFKYKNEIKFIQVVSGSDFKGAWNLETKTALSLVNPHFQSWKGDSHTQRNK